MKPCATLAILVVFQLGCELDGGIGSPINFTRGYTFVRKDSRNVYVADASDFTLTSALTVDGENRHPSLSNDGKKVVYVHSNGSASELWVVATNGGVSPTRVLTATSAQRNFRTPVFSPDGKRIVFVYEEGSVAVLGIVNSDGSGFSRLVGGGALSYGTPSFFPDGAHVLAATGSLLSNLNQLEQISTDTGATVNVSTSLGSEASQIVNRAVLSPDGTRAAFDGRVGSGVTRIFVLELTSKKVTQLTNYVGAEDQSANDSFPTWVGSDRIGFSSDVGGNDQIYELPASATKSSGGLVIPSAIEPWYGPT